MALSFLTTRGKRETDPSYGRPEEEGSFSLAPGGVDRSVHCARLKDEYSGPFLQEYQFLDDGEWASLTLKH